MLSLHHITHAMCIVIISFLLKKHIELRTAHNDLRLEFRQLQLACQSYELQPLAKEQGPLCACSAQPGGHHIPQSHPDIKTQFQTFSGRGSLSSSTTGGNMFADISDSSGVPVDDFGRTLGYAVENDQAQDGIEGSAHSTHFQGKSQSLPLTHPTIQPSVTSNIGVPQVRKGEESARQHVDGLKETGQRTSVGFQKTGKSLEKMNPSSLPVFSFSSMQSSVANHAMHMKAEDDDNDFYEGSRFRQEEDVEVDVIVTGVTGSLYSDLTPHGVDFSHRSFDDEDYEEWEEVEDGEKEEEPHPAFGNMKLEWLTEKEVEEMSIQGSSVQCAGSTVSDRTCLFRHLCFNPQAKQFVFFRSPQSVEDNIPHLKPQEPLLELSTVAGHNGQYFTYVTLPTSDLKNFHVTSIPGTTVVFKRFKPDNIMHVFHDDIIPLFHTIVSLKIKPRIHGEKFPVSLFLADENSEGEFYDLYDAFAANQAFTSDSLIASVTKSFTSDAMVCFSEAHVGLSKTTTWYQYGFFEPQGPIPNSEVKSHHIHSVSSYLMDHYAKECALCGEGGHLVLISRKETRRMLNEMELVLALSKEFRVKVMTVSLETHDLADILPIIHSSLGIVGMHGSLLALGAFLRQGSIMIELFPYAVNPQHYAPYATLSKVPGMLVSYRAWTNQEAAKSVTHPDWSPEFGGVQHLSKQQQQEILSQVEVPRHLCCEDPSWLFHIFQDTYVDIPQVLALLASALKESAPLHTHIQHLPDTKLPGPPQNLRCLPEKSLGNSALVLEWAPPWNMELFVGLRVGYSIGVQEVGGRGMGVVEVGDTLEFRVREGVREGVDYRVWVRSGLEGVYGPFAAVLLCSTK